MPDNTLTLAIDGEITSAQFAKAMTNLDKLVRAITAEVGANTDVEWVIDDLQKSSAVATLRAVTDSPEKADQAIQVYEQVGQALSDGLPPPFSKKIDDSARALVGILGGGITSIKFETARHDVLITSAPPALAARAISDAYGAVEGRIQTLTNRTSLRFTLYDTLHDKGVSCYLDEGQEERIRGLWGKMAVVEGLVSRRPETGIPLTIRSIRDIAPTPEEPEGDYTRAIGVISIPEGAPMPEEIIRRMRDA